MNISELQKGEETFLALGFAQAKESMVYGYDFIAKQFRAIPLTQDVYKQMGKYGFLQTNLVPYYNAYTDKQVNDVELVIKVKRNIKSIYFSYYNKELCQVSKEDIERRAREHKVLFIDAKPILKLDASKIGIMSVGREVQNYAQANKMIVQLDIDRQGRLVLRKCSTKEGMILVPKGIEVISEKAFSQLSLVEQIILPPTIKEVDYGAIDSCPILKYVTGYLDINNVKIDRKFIKDCNNLKVVNLNMK